MIALPISVHIPISVFMLKWNRQIRVGIDIEPLMDDNDTIYVLDIEEFAFIMYKYSDIAFIFLIILVFGSIDNIRQK